MPNPLRVFGRVRNWLAVQRNRGYVYRVLTAAGAVAVAYGVVSEQAVAVLLVLAAQTLGVGVAAANTTTRKG